MRCDSDLHETRTNAEQSETDGDIRVSFESRLPYYEHQLQPNRDYTGIIDCWSDDEAREIFRHLFARFHLLPWDGIQLPPTGLPGFTNAGYDRDGPEAHLLSLGMRYLKAIVFNERRAMHLRWRDAEDFIRTLESNAEDVFYERQAQSAVAEALQRDEQTAAQLVYFIGAPSGPIKIGIAANPRSRLSGLQTAHHEKLDLLATCPGGARQEKGLGDISPASFSNPRTPHD